MNESILRALMRLFAIITDMGEEHKSGNARELVREYLSRQFSRELSDAYLNYFDTYLKHYHKDTLHADPEKRKKKTAVNSVKIYKICTEIRDELELEARNLIVVELLEFIKKENVITSQELEFVNTVAEYLEIHPDDFANIRPFVLGQYTEIPRKDKLLTVNSNDDFYHPEIQHTLRSGLNGRVLILYIESTSTLIFQYNGKQNLYLNGHSIRVNRTYVMSPGSVIRSSRVDPIYFSRILRRFIQAEVTDHVVLKAREVSFQFESGRIGLHPFSFQSESGYLVAIMGSSGTGKSTLMNVLNGNLKLNNGEITINGYDLHRDKEALKGVIGFVPQDEFLIEEFTVYQNLYYNARLCFSDFNEEQIEAKINEALVSFDLVEARDLKVGSRMTTQISGGQRKRLNIALELMREPSILFVDEPTSGLSSLDSEKVMLMLKRQTLKGKLVIVNIHQPSSDIYKLLDRVIMMDQGGRVVFNGNPSDAIIYFNTKANLVNPEESECLVCGNMKSELPLRIIESRMVDKYGRQIRKRKVPPQEWYTMYQEEKQEENQPEKLHEKQKVPENNFQIPGLLKQFRIFLERDVMAKISNKQYVLITLLEAPVLAFILSYFSKFIKGDAATQAIYEFSANKNLPPFLFMSVIVALFLGLVVSAEEIIRDRKILRRESFLNLSRASYINAKVVNLFILSALQSLLYVAISVYMLEIRGLFLAFWLVMFSLTFSANMLGLNISSAMNSVVNVYILIPFVLVPQLLLSGVVINFNDMHRSFSHPKYVPVPGDMMASRWGFEALMVHQYKHNTYNEPLFPYNIDIETANYEVAFRIPNLQKKLDECRVEWLNKPLDEPLPRNLRVLHNEFKKYQRHTLVSPQWKAAAKAISTDEFTPAVARWYQERLNALRTEFIRLDHILRKQRDSLIAQRVEQWGKTGYQHLKAHHHNEAIEMYVRDKMHLDKTFEALNELIRRKDPIYMYPDSPVGRAHFYAPYKRLGDWYVDTLYFNLAFLWLGTFLFYLFLQLDWLRKLLNKMENIYLKYTKGVLNRRV